MAYFSNGTEGQAYEERYCARCVHSSLLFVHWAYFNVHEFLIASALVGGVFGTCVVVEIVKASLVARRRYLTPLQERSLPYQMYRAVKDRVCPLVQIEP